jgi:TM2 domain-containing membrane protein YozV
LLSLRKPIKIGYHLYENTGPMKNLLHPLLMLFFIGLFFSCSIEKRQHLSGYYVEWASPKTSSLNRPVKTMPLEIKQTSHKPINEIVRSTRPEQVHLPITSSCNAQSLGIKAPAREKINQVKPAVSNDDTCDVITFKNGNEIRVKVLEITPKQIKYRYCDPSGNEILSEDKATIFSIKYPNGTKEIINSKEVKNGKTSDPSAAGNKSQIVALLLCIFIGALGIHRFYLGHIGMGILYLLTFGLWGIGVIIDLILILTGDLKPKNGDYSEKL